MDYERLISRLFQDPAERAGARELVAAAESEPLLAARVEAILTEAAKPAVHPDGTPLSPEESWDYMASFMRDGLGLPEHLADSAVPLLGSGTIDGIETVRIEDEGLVDHIEQAMRNDPDGYLRNLEA